MSCKFILDTNALNEKSAKDLRDTGIIKACNSNKFKSRLSLQRTNLSFGLNEQAEVNKSKGKEKID